MAGKLISDLNSVGTLGLADQMEIDKDVSGVRTSYKTSVKDIVDFANQNVAEEYDSTSSYAVGDYCIYESVLYKCTASTTGSFDNTKWTSVVVTDEMGSGGGGTGGHTIIDENGNSMTARAGLQFVGGANVSDDSTNNKTIVDLASAGGIDGVFIDTDNIIQTSTSISTSSDTTYTATEDCVLRYEIYSTSSLNGYLKVDNNWIIETAGSVYVANVIYVKKGQTVTMRSQGSAGSYTVYGIQTGTTHSKFQPVIYSTEEREIGVWTDGKPLYEKTLAIPSLSAGSNTIQHNIANFDKMISCQGRINYDGDDLVVPYMQTQVSGGFIAYGIGISNFNSTRYFIILGNMFDVSKFSGGYVTVRYTKTTDVAGSGSWTPQGVPAVHYSADEQIIGTYLGETLYQRTFDLGSDLLVSTSSWTTLGITLDADKIIETKTTSTSGSFQGNILVYNDNGTWKGQTPRNGNDSSYVRYLTIVYTKTS